MIGKNRRKHIHTVHTVATVYTHEVHTVNTRIDLVSNILWISQLVSYSSSLDQIDGELGVRYDTTRGGTARFNAIRKHKPITATTITMGSTLPLVLADYCTLTAVMYLLAGPLFF